MAFDMVMLVPEMDVVKPDTGLSFMSSDEQLGAVVVRLYCAGNAMMMVESAGTGCEAYGVGLSPTS